ncbi:AraC family transcriptional regulator [Spirosoma areae]
MQDYQKRLSLNLLAYAVQKNLSVEQICRQSGVDMNALTQEATATLTTQQMGALWLNASELSHDPLFGLHFGESSQVSALGVVGELVRLSRTVGEALTQAATFTQLVTDLFKMDVTRSGQSFTIRFIPDGHHQNQSSFVFRQIMDFFMAFTIHEVDGLILQKMRPTAVWLPIDEANQVEYERVFRCESIQNIADYKLEFAGQYWDEPILTADYELQGAWLRKVAAFNDAVGHPKAYSDRIINFLLANAYLGVPTLDAVAANLNVSSRSLQRKLQEEGITYQQLADSMRKSLALHYLDAGQHPIKEVSYILGYNELSAFHRAFRRWTGTTPVAYQKRTHKGEWVARREMA